MGSEKVLDSAKVNSPNDMLAPAKRFLEDRVYLLPLGQKLTSKIPDSTSLSLKVVEAFTNVSIETPTKFSVPGMDKASLPHLVP